MPGDKEKHSSKEKEGKKKDSEPISESDEDIFVEVPPKEETKTEKKDKELKQEKIENKTDKPPLLEHFSKEELISKLKVSEKSTVDAGEKLKKTQEEAIAWKDKFTRMQAEFENAHKRWDKSKQELRTEYIASTLRSFFPLYDSFKKAVESDKDKEIIAQFFNQFLNVFKTYQAEPMLVKKNDKFDYNVHEALTSVERDDLPSNSIIDVIQDGWIMGKIVLRFAKVIISKKPEPPIPPETDEKAKTKPSLEPEKNEPNDNSKEHKNESRKEEDYIS